MDREEPITWQQFDAVELRVGTILEVADFPKAKKSAYQLTIDFGEFGTKRSSAQITTLYTREELVGRQIIAVTNFPPKQVANFMSECLVTGVMSENNDVVLIAPDRKVPNGTRLV